MMNHNYDTQGVEAMNKSCSAVAQKGETFSKTMSLTARLQVACASQIVGHHQLWTRIYASIGLGLGDTLSQYLEKKDRDKTRIKEERKINYVFYDRRTHKERHPSQTYDSSPGARHPRISPR